MKTLSKKLFQYSIIFYFSVSLFFICFIIVKEITTDFSNPCFVLAIIGVIFFGILASGANSSIDDIKNEIRLTEKD